MPKEQFTYWGREYNEPIAYDVHWVDPRFGAWAKQVYGSEKTLFDQIASVVTSVQTEIISRHHPTGGRSQVYDLIEPFIDPHTGLPCFEIDTKGIGLTYAGMKQYNEHFGTDKKYREIFISPQRDHEVWGPEGLSTAEAEVYNIGIVRPLGFITPYPGAILIPREFVIDGRKVSFDNLSKILKVRFSEKPAILLRLYPISSTRASDITGSVDFPAVLNGKFDDFLLDFVLQSRQIWQTFERPRIKKAFLNRLGSKDFDNKYFDYVYATVLSQLAKSIKFGLSPVTGQESRSQTTYHTSLHNWTTSGALVEWAPITRIKTLETKNRLKHLRQLIEHAEEFLVALGQASLTDYSKLPTIRDLFKELSARTGNSDIRQLSESYQSHQPIYPDKNKKSSAVLVQKLGDSDIYIELLKKQQKKLIR